ncbi:unnamed protein product [Clonostachys solani]|uniref:non-specific serine/threonine protein kinase n=1 Tax=Clonostachys solani TaxID=160281 RepID=A0A9N9W2R2_9HYPO|nr:unnamed protein product [Clonostachys solani]
MSSPSIYRNRRYMGEGTRNYRPGGFHPVHLGDVLDGRYHIFRKLGSGSQSTVWLARDSSKQERQYVALKIFEADAGMHQEKVDQWITQDQTPHPGVKFVESPSLGSFTVTGPNGRHYCKVLEPLGGSLSTVLDEAYERREELNECPPAQMKAQKGDGWLTAPAKTICWQVLSGLSFLHSRQVAHRDIRPTNVFTALQYDLSSMHENEIQKSVWATDDVQNEEEDDESNEEKDDNDDDDQDDDDDDDDDDDGDDDNDESGDESTISDPEERLRREQEEEEDRKWLEGFQQRRQKYVEFEAIVNAKWETFGRGDPLAVPHSEEWNKANLIGTRNDIEMLIREDDKDPEPGELQYTVRRTALQEQLDLSKPFRVVLGDLGFAFPFAQCGKHPIATEHVYRPPEDLLDLEITYKADIFSAGLFCWKVVMLDELIQMLSGGGPGYTPSRQLHDLARRLGPIPSEMRANWKQADAYIDKAGNPLDLSEQEKSIYDRSFGEESFQWGDIWHRARIQKPYDMPESDMEVFVDLILKMLQWDPQKRPEAKDLLQHEWFKGCQ